VILNYIDSFVENSRTMGAVGLLLFAVTSIFLLNGITENINAVWGSSSRLGFLRKFSLYISIIVFGTLLIGVAFSFTRSLEYILPDSREISALFRLSIALGPSLIVFLVHWLIIFSIPSAKVRVDSSLIGALAGTVIWEIARYGFVDGTNYILRMSVLYGSIASVPIFLVWLSIQWFVILVAVEISYLHQHGAHLQTGEYGCRTLPYHQLRKGVELYLSIARRFYYGKPPFGLRSLAHAHTLSPNDTEYYLERLQRAGLITFTHSGPSVVLPRKEPAVTTFGEVLAALYGTPGEGGAGSSKSTAAGGNEVSLQFFRHGADAFHNVTVLDMIASEDSEDEA
jgi:membrane protein